MTKPGPRKRPTGRAGHRPGQRPPARPDRADGGPVWLWGSHAVEAALANPARVRHRLVATGNAARRLGLAAHEDIAPAELDRLLPPGAVHQGLALLADPLPETPLEDLVAARPARLAVLDQIADPHNLGAIYRSAAAFGIGGLVLQTRHSPPVTGIVAKAAVGAVERVAETRVVNIARALETLAEAGYLVIGLAGSGVMTLAEAVRDARPLAFVFGAEGAGLRPAVEKACTVTARIPISPGTESLNVSNAAAIAFYEAVRDHGP